MKDARFSGNSARMLAELIRLSIYKLSRAWSHVHLYITIYCSILVFIQAYSSLLRFSSICFMVQVIGEE